MVGTIVTLENTDVKNISIIKIPGGFWCKEDYVICYKGASLRLKIEGINLNHQHSGIQVRPTFETKDIKPLYIHFNGDNEKLNQLSDEIVKRFHETSHLFITDSEHTFIFNTSHDVITTKIDGIKNRKKSDKLIDLLGDIKNSKIDVVVRFEIISDSYDNYLGMIMEKITVNNEVKNLSDQMNSCVLKT